MHRDVDGGGGDDLELLLKGCSGIELHHSHLHHRQTSDVLSIDDCSCLYILQLYDAGPTLEFLVHLCIGQHGGAPDDRGGRGISCGQKGEGGVSRYNA